MNLEDMTKLHNLWRNVVKEYAEEGFINIIGGCCGTGPKHIEAINEVVYGLAPRKPKEKKYFLQTGWIRRIISLRKF